MVTKRARFLECVRVAANTAESFSRKLGGEEVSLFRARAWGARVRVRQLTFRRGREISSPVHLGSVLWHRTPDRFGGP